MPRLRPLIKGIGSYVIPSWRTGHKTLGTLSAEYSYAVFLRHLLLLKQTAPNAATGVVAELGPGSSFGVGFAALLAGAQKYYGLDLIDHSDPKENLRIFDALVTLFAERAAVPSAGAYSQIFPDPPGYDFPGALLGDSAARDAARVADMRRDLEAQGKKYFEVAAPWSDAHIVREDSVDWLISQAVLEHVDELVPTYRDMALWLKPGGYATLLIDFYSHELTDEWNGHWAIEEGTWRLIRGKRPYLINREPLATHLDLASANGLEIRGLIRNKRYDGLLRDAFKAPYSAISDEDARTRMAFVILQKSA